MSLKNKVVLITGGSSGIGAATAVLFAKNGATVAIVGRNLARLESVSEQCESVGKKPLSIQADISVDDKAKEVVNKTVDTFGKLNVLINNAGIVSLASIMTGNLLEEYDKIMNINLRAVINLTTLAAPYLIETKGNIVNVSSIAAETYLRKPALMSYAISKAGLDNFTKGAALELLSKGVRVNSVCPGLTRTNIFSNNGLNRSWEEIRVEYGVHRILEPDEVADLICYLASDKARGIAGVNYVIDNGLLIN